MCMTPALEDPSFPQALQEAAEGSGMTEWVRVAPTAGMPGEASCNMFPKHWSKAVTWW